MDILDSLLNKNTMLLYKLHQRNRSQRNKEHLWVNQILKTAQVAGHTIYFSGGIYENVDMQFHYHTNR